MTCANAAGGGHVKVLEARASGAEWDEWSWAAAAAGGHIHVMEWLMAQLGARAERAVHGVRRRERERAALEWARAHGAPWDAGTTAEAAGAGDLDLLRWCRERGCDWDEEAPSSAAANGHLHVLRYCREAGCPIDELEAVHRAQEEGHLDVVRWVVEHGDLHLPPWDLPEVWQPFGGGPQWPTPACESMELAESAAERAERPLAPRRERVPHRRVRSARPRVFVSVCAPWRWRAPSVKSIVRPLYCLNRTRGSRVAALPDDVTVGAPLARLVDPAAMRASGGTRKVSWSTGMRSGSPAHRAAR